MVLIENIINKTRENIKKPRRNAGLFIKCAFCLLSCNIVDSSTSMPMASLQESAFYYFTRTIFLVSVKLPAFRV